MLMNGQVNLQEAEQETHEDNIEFMRRGYLASGLLDVKKAYAIGEYKMKEVAKNYAQKEGEVNENFREREESNGLNGEKKGIGGRAFQARGVLWCNGREAPEAELPIDGSRG